MRCASVKYLYIWPTSSFVIRRILAPWGDEGPDAVIEDEARDTLQLIGDDIALKSKKHSEEI